jgi:quercetin dioxygenase-like cupin family protein
MSMTSEQALPPSIHRAGENVGRSPEGIASAPFWVEMLVDSNREGELTAMRATLEPGTLTHWHSHPDGQILYVLSGVGLAQRKGAAIEELRAGDCITFLPGEVHWHGATAHSPFAYISIQGFRGGRAADWFQPVEAN